VSFLELAQNAYSEYVRQEPKEKADLLKHLLSNCSIKNLTLYPTYRIPFNYLVEIPQNDIWRRR